MVPGSDAPARSAANSGWLPLNPVMFETNFDAPCVVFKSAWHWVQARSEVLASRSAP